MTCSSQARKVIRFRSSIAIGAFVVDCFFRADAVDGPIAANHGQGLTETLFAFLGVFNQIVDPLLLLV